MNTPKSQNPEGKVVAYCQPDDPIPATAFSWPGSARNPKHTMELIPATALADAERRAQYWKDEHLAGNAIIDDMQRRLEAVEDAVSIAINTLICSCRPAGNSDVNDAAEIRHAVKELRNARNLLLRDGKGDGVSTAEGEG